MTKRRRKLKSKELERRGKYSIVLSVLGLICFTFFGGNEMLSASNNTENYLAAGMLLALIGLFVYGIWSVLKSIK